MDEDSESEERRDGGQLMQIVEQLRSCMAEETKLIQELQGLEFELLRLEQLDQSWTAEDTGQQRTEILNRTQRIHAMLAGLCATRKELETDLDEFSNG